jgi:hypothetical protein
MSRVVITKEQWEIARTQWEGDPLVSYGDIAKSLGTSRQTVKQHADRNDWQRRLDMQAVSEKAHAQADSKFTYSAVESSEQAPSVYADPSEIASRPPVRPGLPVVPPGMPTEGALRAVETAAVDQRAEVLTKHRKELLAVRSQVYGAMKSPDIEAAKRAKILAEGVKVLHDTERKAWGLDMEPPKPGQPGTSVVVKITRKSGTPRA